MVEEPRFSAHHIALSVEDLEASVAFYGVLGFREQARDAPGGGDSACVHLRLGELVLELFWFRDRGAPPSWASDLRRDLRHVGVKHLGLRVDAVDAAHAHLRRRGLQPATEPKAGRLGGRYFFLTDPSGNFVEISGP